MRRGKSGIYSRGLHQKNRQQARAACCASMDANGCPKIFAAGVLTSAKNQFVLGVNSDQVELTWLFVFSPAGGHNSQNPVAIRLQDAGGRFLAPSTTDAVGAGWGFSGSESVGCVWVVAWAVIRAVVMGLSR